MQAAKDEILKAIKRRGHGFAFSPKDFLGLASRGTIDMTFSGLAGGGIIRRIGRGLYDYPKKSDLVDELLPPDSPNEAQSQKIQRYEAHLERSLYKALHELQRLQAIRRGQMVPRPRGGCVSERPSSERLIFAFGPSPSTDKTCAYVCDKYKAECADGPSNEWCSPAVTNDFSSHL